MLIPAEGAAGSVLDRTVHRRTGSRPSVPALVGIGLAVVILAGIVSNNGSDVLALVLIGAVALLAHRAQRPVASPPGGGWDPSNPTAAVGTSPTAGSSERYAAGGAYAPYGGSAYAPYGGSAYAPYGGSASPPYGGSASPPYGGVPVASPWPDWPGGTAVESRPRPPRSVLGLVTVSVCLLVVGALLVVANLTALQVMAAAVLATALVVVGLGLLVGARFGRSRGLMLLGVPLAAATLGDLGGVDAGGCRPGGTDSGSRRVPPSCNPRTGSGLGTALWTCLGSAALTRVRSPLPWALAGCGSSSPGASTSRCKDGRAPGTSRCSATTAPAGGWIARSPTRASRPPVRSPSTSGSELATWRWTVHRHDLDTLSLVAGLLYLGVGVAVLLGVGLPRRLLAPALLIAAGAVGLVASRRRLDPPTGGSDPKA